MDIFGKKTIKKLRAEIETLRDRGFPLAWYERKIATLEAALNSSNDDNARLREKQRLLESLLSQLKINVTL